MNQEAKEEIAFLTSSITFEQTQQSIWEENLLISKQAEKISKSEIRSSLKASTLEAVYGTLFYSINGGVLLSNFLLELGASPLLIAFLISVPQLLNLFQPLGAYFADRSQSRKRWSISIFLTSRLLWLIVALAIFWGSSFHIDHLLLVQLTLAVILITNIIEAFGRASNVSWMAALVPERLRGRYFGFRNSAINLMNLLAMPLLGFVVSKYPRGAVQGFGIVLVIGILFGLISLGYQLLMTDVNPIEECVSSSNTNSSEGWGTILSFLKDANFLKFLLYSALWSFAVHVSAPFFNLYLLDNLSIDVSVVTIYNSLTTGANLLMLIIWGKLADRLGNRPLLIIVGMFVAFTPLLWLFGQNDTISLWVWFPLLHLLAGATWAAIELCSVNLLMAIAPLANRSIYFAIAAAVPGITGAMGIIFGGISTTLPGINSWSALVSFSAFLRLFALLPLIFVWEQRSVPLSQLWQVLFVLKQETAEATIFQPDDSCYTQNG